MLQLMTDCFLIKEEYHCLRENEDVIQNDEDEFLEEELFQYISNDEEGDNNSDEECDEVDDSALQDQAEAHVTAEQKIMTAQRSCWALQQPGQYHALANGTSQRLL